MDVGMKVATAKVYIEEWNSTMWTCLLQKLAPGIQWSEPSLCGTGGTEPMHMPQPAGRH